MINMKILQIIFSLSPGGAERFVVDLSNELSKNNDVILLTLKDFTKNPEGNFLGCPVLCSNINSLV